MTLPPYFEKALALYNYLKENADEQGKVSFTQQDAMGYLGYPANYASRLKQVLEDSGSVTQLQRGARNRTSIWLLHEPPALEKYLELEKAGEFVNFTSHQSDTKLRLDMQAQQIRVMNERLNVLEQNMEVILSYIERQNGSQGATQTTERVRN